MATSADTTTTKRAYATPNDVYSTADIFRIHESAIIPAKRWNSKVNLRQFSTRILDGIYKGEGGIYFVASKKRPAYKDVEAGERVYVVYQFNPATAAIWEPSAKDVEDKLLGYTTAKAAKVRAQAFADNKVERL